MSQNIRIKRGTINNLISTLQSNLQKGELIISTGSGTFPFIADSGSFKNSSMLYFSNMNGKAIAANRIIISGSAPPNLNTDIYNGVLYYDSVGRKLYALNYNGTTTNHVEIAGDSVLGDPHNGTYMDGLFTEFTQSTPVGHAIDKINEVLKELAPPPAPYLSFLANNPVNNSDVRTSANLSFGTSNGITGFSNVEGIGSLSSVDFRGLFNRSNNPLNRPIRIGVLTTNQSVTLNLNDEVLANGSPSVNYPAGALRVPNPWSVETYRVFVNDSSSPRAVFTVTSPAAFNQTSNNVVLNLSATQSGAFPSSGASFNLFKHRTGNVTIQTIAQRKGWNFVRVEHTSSLGAFVTNYCDWVNDPDTSGINTTIDTFTSSSNFEGTGLRWISGVPYFTAIQQNTLIVTASNYFRNHYSSTSTVNFSISPSFLNGGNVGINVPLTHMTNLSASHLATTNPIPNRLLSQSFQCTVSIPHITKPTVNSSFNSPTFLLDNVTAPSPTQWNETFVTESRRVPVGVYNDVASLNAAVFQANNALNDDELMVYNGRLIAPMRSLNNGNIAGAGIQKVAGTLPDYSGRPSSGLAYYYRRFHNDASDAANFRITIKGSYITFVGNNPANQNEVYFMAHAPGVTTGPVKITVGGTPSTVAGSNNLVGSAPSNITGATEETRTWEFTFVNSVSGNNPFLIIICARNDWQGHISDILITKPS